MTIKSKYINIKTKKVKRGGNRIEIKMFYENLIDLYNKYKESYTQGELPDAPNKKKFNRFNLEMILDDLNRLLQNINYQLNPKEWEEIREPKKKYLKQFYRDLLQILINYINLIVLSQKDLFFFQPTKSNIGFLPHLQKEQYPKKNFWNNFDMGSQAWVLEKRLEYTEFTKKEKSFFKKESKTYKKKIYKLITLLSLYELQNSKLNTFANKIKSTIDTITFKYIKNNLNREEIEKTKYNLSHNRIIEACLNLDEYRKECSRLGNYWHLLSFIDETEYWDKKFKLDDKRDLVSKIEDLCQIFFDLNLFEFLFNLLLSNYLNLS